MNVYGAHRETPIFCDACPVQLRYAHNKWGNPLGKAGRKWLAEHPHASLQLRPPPGANASAADAGHSGNPFPSAWLPMPGPPPGPPPMLSFGNSCEPMGVHVPPRFGFRSALGSGGNPASGTMSLGSMNQMPQLFGLGVLFERQERKSEEIQAQLDVLMASNPT